MSKDGAKQIKSVYFDGRKDPTLVKLERERKVCKETNEKKHVSLIEEPLAKGKLLSSSLLLVMWRLCVGGPWPGLSTAS